LPHRFRNRDTGRTASRGCFLNDCAAGITLAISRDVRRPAIVRLLLIALPLLVTDARLHAREESGRWSHGSPQKRPPTAKARVQYDDYQVAAGTPLMVQLRTALDSASAEIDDAARAALVEPVSQDGVELIPKGSVIHGKVIEVVHASRQNRTGRIVLQFHVIEHLETHSHATIETRAVPFDATLGPKEKFRDVRVPTDERVILTLASPLLVHIPRSR
jgi:hypothetical protein